MEDAEKISRIKARNDIDKDDPLIVSKQVKKNKEIEANDFKELTELVNSKTKKKKKD